MITRTIFFAAVLPILATLAVAGSSRQSEEPRIIGYVWSGRLFFPLVVLDSDGLTAAESQELNLLGTLVPAFEPRRASSTIARQKDDDDPFSQNPNQRYGILETRIAPERGDFYYLNGPSGEPLATLAGRDSIAASYHRYWLSRARRVDASIAPELSADEYAQQTGVRVHYVTDLDGDGRQEIWVTQRLMWGDIEVKVLEAADGPDRWERIVIHCWACD